MFVYQWFSHRFEEHPVCVLVCTSTRVLALSAILTLSLFQFKRVLTAWRHPRECWTLNCGLRYHVEPVISSQSLQQVDEVVNKSRKREDSESVASSAPINPFLPSTPIAWKGEERFLTQKRTFFVENHQTSQATS